MGEVGLTVLTCYKSFLFKGIGVKHLPVNYPSKHQCHDQVKITQSKSRSPLVIKNQMTKPATYSSRISTNTPFFESPEASFDDYLEDKARVVKAIFPDKRRSRRLNEEEWRIQMLPLQFLFLTAWPVIYMRLRYRSQGIGYPDGVPRDTTKVVELDITRWELQGLDNILELSEFSLCVKGSLYPERRGAQSRLKFQLLMNISSVLPPVLSLVPEHVRFRVVESVLKTLVEDMKHKVNGNLLADYSEFKKEKLKRRKRN